MKTVAMILAAGRENQMHSARAKELHELMGLTLLERTLDAVSAVADETVAVLGHHAAELAPALPQGIRAAVQDFTRGCGTAKAAQAGMALIGPEVEKVLIAAGDMPLVSPASYRQLVDAVDGVRCRAAVLYADVANPAGYDRVIFDGDGNVKRIARAGELAPYEEDIPSINASVYCFSREVLAEGLPQLEPEAGGLYHLSGVAAFLASDGETVAAIAAADPREAVRIVTRRDLATAIQYIRELNCNRHMDAGVTILDPATTYIESGVEIGPDTVIYPGCYLQGKTKVGARCLLLPGCRLMNTTLGEGCTAEQCVLIGQQYPAGTAVPPFTHRA